MTPDVTYEKPAIVNVDMDPGLDHSIQTLAPIVIAVVAISWIVVGVEIVTYSKKGGRRTELKGRHDGPRLVTLPPPQALDGSILA